MGTTYHNKPIVTDGLVFCVDPANKVSYPRSGTTVNDLIDNSTTGSLLNSVGFENSFAGIFNFDGTDGYIQFNFDQITTPASISIWVNTDVNDSSQRYAIINGRADQTPYLYLRMATDNTYQVPIFNSNGSDTLQGSSATTSTWFCFNVICDVTQTLLYENGSLKDSSSINWNGINIDNNNNWALGRDSRDQRYWYGNIGPVHIYNRALSANEVLQNYNALKNRFI